MEQIVKADVHTDVALNDGVEKPSSSEGDTTGNNLWCAIR